MPTSTASTPLSEVIQIESTAHSTGPQVGVSSTVAVVGYDPGDDASSGFMAGTRKRKLDTCTHRRPTLLDDNVRIATGNSPVAGNKRQRIPTAAASSGQIMLIEDSKSHPVDNGVNAVVDVEHQGQEQNIQTNHQLNDVGSLSGHRLPRTSSAASTPRTPIPHHFVLIEDSKDHAVDNRVNAEASFGQQRQEQTLQLNHEPDDVGSLSGHRLPLTSSAVSSRRAPVHRSFPASVVMEDTSPAFVNSNVDDEDNILAVQSCALPSRRLAQESRSAVRVMSHSSRHPTARLHGADIAYGSANADQDVSPYILLVPHRENQPAVQGTPLAEPFLNNARRSAHVNRNVRNYRNFMLSDMIQDMIGQSERLARVHHILGAQRQDSEISRSRLVARSDHSEVPSGGPARSGDHFGERSIRFNEQVLLSGQFFHAPWHLPSAWRGFAHEEISSLGAIMNDLHQAAHPAMVDALPVRTASSRDTSLTCCICLCDVEVGDLLRTLPCTHQYHMNCIDAWLSRNGCCPVDKSRIDGST